MNLYEIMNEVHRANELDWHFFCICKKGFLFYDDKGIDTCRGLQPSWVCPLSLRTESVKIFFYQILLYYVVSPVRKFSRWILSSWIKLINLNGISLFIIF